LALRAARSSGLPVVFVATGWAGDAEMERRIARHRAERPPGWEVIEERVDLAGALRGAPAECCLVLDCLSLWVANLMREGIDGEEIERRGAEAAELAAGRPGPTVAVTNEVGLGVVPASASGRAFRDALGRVNALWAQRSTQAVLVVAGRALPLEHPNCLIEGLWR
jgi:adenosyl cobinamide kinase/adenosyl cobinamide phosphate guanylyltransferase